MKTSVKILYGTAAATVLAVGIGVVANRNAPTPTATERPENPYGSRCTDPIWFLEACGNSPTQLGATGSGDSCAFHSLSVGDEITEDHKLYLITDQCPVDLDQGCRKYGMPADSAGPAAIARWRKCFVPPEGCGPNQKYIRGADGIDYQTSRKPPESAGVDAVNHWNTCYLPRYQVDRSCPGRPMPGGRQVLPLYTLATLPIPPPNAEIVRASIARSYGCDLGLPTATPAPPRTPSKTATGNRTPPRVRTATRGPQPCDAFPGGPICTPTINRTRTLTRTPLSTRTVTPSQALSATPVFTAQMTATPTVKASITPTATVTVVATPRPTPTKPSSGGCGNRGGTAVAGLLVAGVLVAIRRKT